MRARTRIFTTFTLLAGALLLAASPADAGRRRGSHEAEGFQNFASPQSNPIAISPDGTRVYVANTTSGTVDVIDTGIQTVIRTIKVGLDPVSVAFRPDGLEVWVSNHVSDTVSVIDNDTGSATQFQVIETIQDISNGVTDFDEPVGIAFADNTKAYVALSSSDRVAIVDATTYSVTGHLTITAQDPRALTVAAGKLYVAAFESGNRTQVSACVDANFPDFGYGSPPDCTLTALDLITFATNPNIPGVDKNIVVNDGTFGPTDEGLPDRDVFVFRTNTDNAFDTLEGVGTLLYGIVVDSTEQVYVTQTEARNAVNGLEGQNLIDMDNRIFLNQIGTFDCSGGGSCGSPSLIELEPLPPSNPAAGDELATPYGAVLSADDSTLVATAAASSRIFSLDTGSGTVLDRLDVGEIPRGIAMDSTGDTGTAYVLNTLDNSVSVVSLGVGGTLALTGTIPVGSDPTPNDVRLGRIAFNDADASDTGTFACASCHPDGNTDQLLWRIGGACFFGACTGDDEPRSTMPIRGLQHTVPLHWDGTLGDPFGGGNGAVGVGGAGGTDCVLGDADGDDDCFFDLVQESLSGVMCDQAGACPLGGNQLTLTERENMGRFLEVVSYPPPRLRNSDDTVSTTALDGFADFFVDQDGGGNPDTCADSDAGCHNLPLGAFTNSATLNGFDVPTMRGMTDRFLQFSLGPTGAVGTLDLANAGAALFGLSPLEAPIQWDFDDGLREITVFGAAFLIFEPTYGVRPIDMFQMFEEASTGFSGAVGRQVTLNTATALQAGTVSLMDDIEAADMAGLVNVRGEGLRNGFGLSISFRPDGTYKNGSNTISLTPAALRAEADAGTTLVTLTAKLRQNVGDLDSLPQPIISPNGLGGGPTGDPNLPTSTSMTLQGVDVRNNGQILVNGVVDGGASLTCNGGNFTPFCDSFVVDITVTNPGNGLHLLQVQNPGGLLSNELPFCIGPVVGCE